VDAFHFSRDKEAIMKGSKKILTIAFAMFLLMVGVVYEASAQSRRVVVRRPVIVRSYVYRDPFWYSRYYYDPFYDPYYQARQQRYYLENRVAGNTRELQEHLRKYRADGVITAKERRELEDDYKDVAESRRRLSSYSRY
jgi:hypothetical protein